MTRCLTPQEMASLNRALAKRTGTRVRVGPAPISVALGIALWDAAASFGEGPRAASRGQPHKSRLASGQDGAPLRRVLGAGAALAATVTLGACTSLGSNIQGNFSCRAPDGICAPTSTIDDAALALIGGDESVIPAGPYSAPSTETPRLYRTAANEPVRSSEKVLRIVFPSHIDRAGRFRETTAIHAVVERAVWTTASASPAPRMSAAMLQEPSQQFAQRANRSLGELASIAPEVRFPDPVASLRSGSAGGPGAAPLVVGASASASTSTMAALNYSLPPQAVGGAPNPIESIRAQVAQRLKATAPSVATPPMVSAADRPPPAEASDEAATAAAVNRPSLFPVSGINP